MINFSEQKISWKFKVVSVKLLSKQNWKQKKKQNKLTLNKWRYYYASF